MEEELGPLTDFRRQESIKNEQLLVDQKTFFIEYKAKMEQKMAETTKFYQDQMAAQEKSFLEQKDSLLKKVKDFDDQMAAVSKLNEEQMASLSAANAKLERQNEILFMTIAKLSETGGSSKAKDNEKAMDREKPEGRVVVNRNEKMEEEV